MGSGASADSSKKLADASPEDIKSVFASLPADKQEQIMAALKETEPISFKTILTYNTVPLKPDAPPVKELVEKMDWRDVVGLPGLKSGKGCVLLAAKVSQGEGEEKTDDLVIQAWYTEPGSTLETVKANTEPAMKAMGAIKDFARAPPQRGPADGFQVYFPGKFAKEMEPTEFTFTRVCFTPKEGVTKDQVFAFVDERAAKLQAIGAEIGEIYALRCVWNEGAGNFELGGFYRNSEAAETFMEKGGGIIKEVAGEFTDKPPASRVKSTDCIIWGRN